MEKTFKRNTTEFKLQKKFKEILELMELPIQDENFKDTPYRLAKMWSKELMCNRNKDIAEEDNLNTTFTNSNYKHYIHTGRILYTSVCSHHIMPFEGSVDIVYQPNDILLGLSKFPRIVKFLSKRPQLQESFTEDIADYLQEILQPAGLYVLVTGRHTCVTARGIEMATNKVTTAILKGNLNMQEVSDLIKLQRSTNAI